MEDLVFGEVCMVGCLFFGFWVFIGFVNVRCFDFDEMCCVCCSDGGYDCGSC